MIQSEAQERAAVISEALSWQRTPWHHKGRVKGAGVDCAMYLSEVYHRCGLIPRIDPGDYPPDWHLHRDEERFLAMLLQFSRPVDEPKPADIAAYRFGRCVSHGAIVIVWPTVIHSYRDAGCVTLDNALMSEPMSSHFHGFFRLNGWAD